jgi:hypothetical protein
MAFAGSLRQGREFNKPLKIGAGTFYRFQISDAMFETYLPK